MPEFRQNLATGEWIIIAAERGKRPEAFKRAAQQAPPVYDPHCPFCPGKEADTPEAILTVPPRAAPGAWEVRVVPNKFPALTPDGEECMPCSINDGPYLKRKGIGRHEVLIESPLHNSDLPLLSMTHIEAVVRTYSQRYNALVQIPSTGLVLLFRNHGPNAGTSLVHPHAQIVASSLVPTRVRTKLYEGQRYYDTYQRCVYCDMLAYELEQQQRIIMENEHFVAFAPYASRMPYEMKLLPRRHHPAFSTLAAEELRDMAHALRNLLARLWRLLGNPDYNFVLDTAPEHLSRVPFYHWHLEIIPKITTPAGFEIGSGIGINIVPPEQAAADLRATDGARVTQAEAGNG